MIRILRFVFKDDGVAGRMAHWLPNGYSRLLGMEGMAYMDLYKLVWVKAK